MSKYLYVGPTWAQKSFDNKTDEFTNFAIEWNIPYTQYIIPSGSPLKILDQIKKLNNLKPIIWVYSDPWGDITRITGLTFAEFMGSSDWDSIWKQCSEYTLNEIDKLNVPVFLFGTHCDVLFSEFSNIHIADRSMQSFMANQLSISMNAIPLLDGRTISIDYCIAMELYYKFIYDNPTIHVDPKLKKRLDDLFDFWDVLRYNNLMYDVHPTMKSYKLYASFLKPNLKNFLQL